MSGQNYPAEQGALGQAARPALFAPGDRVQITGPKGRQYTITLVEGGSFQSKQGTISHDAILGLPDGQVVNTAEGTQFQLLRPRLVDYVLSMPRGAAIIYPKDSAQIVAHGDIYPGASVLEAGVGSGALTLSLLSAVGPSGTVQSVEKRADFADIAAANVDLWFGQRPASWSLAVESLEEYLAASGTNKFDRVVLDLLDPWSHLEGVEKVLTAGGVLTCYVTTVSQLSTLAEALKASGRFTDPEVWESVNRPWHLEGLAVRPEHRMIGHTGFLLVSRKLARGVIPLALKKRPAPAAQGLQDQWGPQDEWQPEITGQRTASDKKVRRIRRELRSKVDTWVVEKANDEQ